MQNQLNTLAFCIVVAIIAVVQVSGEFVKCEKTHRKVGCKAVGATEMLVNDRAHDAQYPIDWYNIVPYLHSLACRCAERARESGFSHFGIRFYGECWGLDKDDLKDAASSDACFQSQSYGPCDDNNEEECGGADDEYVYELLPAKVNGNYGPWDPFGQCSKSCGGGIQVRTRECDNPKPQNGGNDCKELGDASETQSCNEQKCQVFGGKNPINGGFGAWGKWSSCNKSCGWGRKTRSRKCNNPTPANGGKACKGKAKQTRKCRVKKCKGKKSRVYRRFICEGKQTTIKCEKGEQIKIRFANYGRLGARKCLPKGKKHKVCRSPKTNEKVQQLCNGKNSCSLEASNKIFGDTCIGIKKYLKVAWKCVK